MRVAVLGGGVQGCCTALALAEKGVRVTLFDRNDELISRAGLANEGKIHLGYMYASDPSLNTAITMVRGALSFAPFLSRHLGLSLDGLATSEPAHYLVHRDSLRELEVIEAYLEEVHNLVGTAANGRDRSYFGADLTRPLRRWADRERENVFDSQTIAAAFETPEVAVNPVALGQCIREGVSASPWIDVRCGQTVAAVRELGHGIEVETEGFGETACDPFDHVVNALWDGRLAVDRSFGIAPSRPWLHRLKYGVSFRIQSAERPPSATIISGPFGEVVSYGEGLTYLTWYPECVRAITNEMQPPDWPTYPAEPIRSSIVNGTFEALANIIRPLRALNIDALADVHVKGGAIVAWGETDIYDLKSELHQRHRVGIASQGRFHSVDPGKLTLAPYFAQACANRITGEV